MYRHIVLFWLKDPSEENLRQAKEKLASLQGKIEGLLSVEVEADTLRSERSCDLCLNMAFATWEALCAYRTHPAHLPVQKHMHAVRSASSAADYEITSPARRAPRLYGLLGPASSEERTIQRLLDAGLCGMCLRPGGRETAAYLPWAEALHGAAARAGVAAELLVDFGDAGADGTAPEAPLALGGLPALGVTGVILPSPGESGLAAARAQLPGVRLMAEIASPEDLERLPALLRGADGLALARDSLAKRAPIAQIPAAQKRAAAAAVSAGKPLLISGGLLSSMRWQKDPTPAEAADVHAAVADGASSLLLLGETAWGPDPVRAVEALRAIAEAAAMA